MREKRNRLTGKESEIRNQAAAWLVERDEGWDPSRETEFNAWKSEDIRHELALRDLDATWNRLKRLRHLIDDPMLRPDPDMLSTGFQKRRRRRTLLALASSFAAAIVVALGIWGAFDHWVGKETEATFVDTYSTHNNDYKQITLQDGSVMEMNANTQARINFSEEQRQIILLSGEAHFKVEKDKSRPFLVYACSVTVKAIGTEFNVQFDQDEIHVLVTEGRVSVIPLPDEPSKTVDENFAWTVPELVAGDLATISKQGGHLVPLMSKLEPEEKEEILAWKGPRLFFDATPLNEAVRQFNKHNSLQVKIEDDELQNLSIGGSFLVEDVEAFVRLLALDNSITVERTRPDELVLKHFK